MAEEWAGLSACDSMSSGAVLAANARTIAAAIRKCSPAGIVCVANIPPAAAPKIAPRLNMPWKRDMVGVPIRLSTATPCAFIATSFEPAIAPNRNKAANRVTALKANAGAKLTISGFHSASGDLAQNQELAKQRALSVRDALKAAGIAEDRVVLAKPMSAEANLAGEDPKARRVDVAVK